VTALWDLPETDDVVPPSRGLLRLLRPAVRAVMSHRYDVHTHGEEHLPRTGPLIVVSNHIGLLDGPLLAAYFPRPLHALTKKEMFTGATGHFLRAVGQVPLSRHDVDLTAVKTCVRVLRDGGVVAIYPEGTRGDGQVHQFRPGAAYLALVTGAPVVPVAVFGTRERGGGVDSVPPRGSRFDFVYGEPVYLAAQPWPRTQSQVRRAGAELRNKLVAHVVDAMSLTGRTLPGPIPGLGPADIEAVRPGGSAAQPEDPEEEGP
jgi:1-acyl-sn-glycerol-3-phosphate acyltransferase